MPPATLQQQALAELELRRRKRAGLSLLDFVPAITPRWDRPEHLPELAKLFDRIETEEVSSLNSYPPQHGKTETLLHGVSRYLLRHPERTVAYVSYMADVAHSKSALARDYATRAGVQLRGDSSAKNEWRTTAGGGMLATGIEGPLTSHGVQLLIVDDPHKNRSDAESQILRDKVHAWYTSTALTRLHPGGSVIVVHTRWHEDDLIGRLSQEKDETTGKKLYEYTNVPAVLKSGKALWPKHRPLKWLRRQAAKLGGLESYDWWSLYMGSPRPRGEGLFGAAAFFKERPKDYRVAIGIDCAYSKKTYADWSVAVVMAQAFNERGEPVYYILDVVRRRQRIRQFREKVKELCKTWNAVARWYVGGQENVIAEVLEESDHVRDPENVDVDEAELMRRAGVPLNVLPANADKFVRAQPFAGVWNASRVFLQEGAEWAPEFIRELQAFPLGRHDDQVDAAAAAFDELAAYGGGLADTSPSDDDYRFGESRGF